jgi:hypothetical protein
VVVARSPRTTYGALRQRRGLPLPAVGVAVVSAALTWLFARVALRPVERVVAAADHVDFVPGETITSITGFPDPALVELFDVPPSPGVDLGAARS